MEVNERELAKLELADGVVPFNEWCTSLKDKRLQAGVEARLAQVRAGNLGDFKRVGKGVLELRIHRGPGLRIYCGLLGKTLVVLIGGGDKSTQVRDIIRAQELWKDLKNEITKL